MFVEVAWCSVLGGMVEFRFEFVFSIGVWIVSLLFDLCCCLWVGVFEVLLGDLWICGLVVFWMPFCLLVYGTCAWCVILLLCLL